MNSVINFTPEIINDDAIEIKIDKDVNNKNNKNNENNENNVNNENNENNVNNVNNENNVELEINIDTKNTLKKIGSKTFRTKIIEDYIRPNMIRDIKNSFLWRDRWSKISSTSFCFSEIIGLIQTVMAFSAASFNLVLISYLAGTFGILCIALNRFGSYAKNESSEKTSQLNEILVTVGIKDKIPDLMDGNLQDNDIH
jgi:hypothetical protein